MDIDEKKEVVYESFSRSFDKDMAYKKALLSLEDMETLNNDIEFQQRLDQCLIIEKEKLIQNLRSFMDSENEKVSFEATKELSKLLYPEFFKSKDAKDPLEVNLTISNEDKETLKEEIGYIIEDNGAELRD